MQRPSLPQEYEGAKKCNRKEQNLIRLERKPAVARGEHERKGEYEAVRFAKEGLAGEGCTGAGKSARASASGS